MKFNDKYFSVWEISNQILKLWDKAPRKFYYGNLLIKLSNAKSKWGGLYESNEINPKPSITIYIKGWPKSRMKMIGIVAHELTHYFQDMYDSFPCDKYVQFTTSTLDYLKQQDEKEAYIMTVKAVTSYLKDRNKNYKVNNESVEKIFRRVFRLFKKNMSKGEFDEVVKEYVDDFRKFKNQYDFAKMI